MILCYSLHLGQTPSSGTMFINMSYFNDVTEASSMEPLYLEKLKNCKTSKTNLNFSVIGHNFNCNNEYSNFI